MEHLGELIIACAGRSDAVLWMQRGAVHVCVGSGALSKVFSARCGDGKAIANIIKVIKSGAYAPKAAASQKKEAA